MTKEYLKMADVFGCKVEPGRFNYAMANPKATYAAHAINSHDELVAEVERLRGMIDALEKEHENIIANILDKASALGVCI